MHVLPVRLDVNEPWESHHSQKRAADGLVSEVEEGLRCPCLAFPCHLHDEYTKDPI